MRWAPSIARECQRQVMRTTCKKCSGATHYVFDMVRFFFFSLLERTAPRRRRLTRMVVSGKGLKQKSEKLFFSLRECIVLCENVFFASKKTSEI